MNQESAQKIYEQYLRGKELFEKHSYYERCEESWRFYQGDQWKGLKTIGDAPPILNILSPIVDHKVARIAQNGMSITYSPLITGERYPIAVSLCRRLTSYARGVWERLKMDREIWNFTTQAAVCGDCFIYFHYAKGDIQMEELDTTSIFMADETSHNLQEQKYIIIARRLYTRDVREIAKENGVASGEIERILPDSPDRYSLGGNERESASFSDEAGKTLCLMKMWKEGGEVHFIKCTKDVIYQEDTAIPNLGYYPIAQFTWKKEKGFSRGIGEIYPRISNQIEINKALARYLAGIRNCAYPHVVYNKQVVPNAKDISRLVNTVGSVIGLDSPKMQRIDDVISYLEPAQINPAALNIIDELISRTRDLAGAGEAATGSINPEMASGAAIIAVRDEAALPLNNQQAHLKQFAEDIAMIWMDIFRAYNPQTITFEAEGPAKIPLEEVLPARLLDELKVSCAVDISPKNPYSRYAQEQSLQNLLSGGFITFEEFVDSLDDDSASPKGKLMEILKKRSLYASAMPAEEAYPLKGALKEANEVVEDE